ncbi:hypothetical protein TVAG_235940 [Trichomonas vaginalis G3]|uniref:Uncharacterized protein n=1 Tax=Trichomonas vaginalis (strain ATCC PRA-98 / G3) TaxID=412133 RepID=A2FBE8_TRIV3|nr:spectrin binding [Trichomonas vaginalis G3]EAX97782.1 hypothetical protein TVAG_235940 [Trichomonas vaginalis G3]KAI5499037.1 spectrin binding [Trichomonas vaginalis G3]|eukprot:XP_001310712.1 hypothetical protein [Trichomonas vaginalis G3]
MNIPLPTETPMAEMDSEYLLDVFKAPNQLSKLIWGLNSENFDQYTDQIINLIKTQNVPPQMAFHFINIVAEFKSKQISLYSDLYQRILNEFSLNIKPDCSQLAILLYDKGFHDFLSEPPTSEEIHKILNPYEENTVNFYIASDRVDMIEPKFSDIPLNGKKMKDPPLDVAIINGSELCFNYFRNKGAKYTDSSRVSNGK